MSNQPLVTQVVDALVPLLASLLVALISWIGVAVQRNIQSSTARNVAQNITDLAGVVVKDLEQTVVAGMRAAAADGVITRAEAGVVRDAALMNLRSHLGEKGKKEALTAFGFESEAAFDAYLSAQLEAAVLRTKSEIGRKISSVASLDVEGKS